MEGEEDGLSSLITRCQLSIEICQIPCDTRWKTVNIDVDKKGRPCKERLLQVLTRQRMDEKGFLTDVIKKDAFAGNVVQQEDVLAGEPRYFTFKKAERLMDYFSQTRIEHLMHQLFTS